MTLIAHVALPLATFAQPQAACPVEWVVNASSSVTRVDCRAVNVPQDWRDPEGPLTPVTLSVLRFESQRRGAPVLFLAGGPGESALDVVEQALLDSPVGQAILQSRPLIVFDRRGAISPSRRAAPDLGLLAAGVPVSGAPGLEALRDSADRTSAALRRQRVEPRFFTTLAALDDIRAVLQSYGYRKVILYATSYGTKEALQFMRRHPRMVEAAILDGVVAPPHEPLPGATAGSSSGPAAGAGAIATERGGVHSVVHDAVLCGDSRAGIPWGGGRMLCDALRVRFDGAGATDAVRSDIPTLLLSASGDVQTPPTMAAEAARTLSRARSFELPSTGHIVSLLPSTSACVAEIVQAFLAAPERDPRRPCLDHLRP